MLTDAISTSRPSWSELQEIKTSIQLQMLSEPCLPEIIINQLASIKGPVDVYFWYEGASCLPESGAQFMKEQFFEPLYNSKPDAKLYLYSLSAWNFRKTINAVPSSTPLGRAINKINTAALECIYSSSFFQYCAQVSTEEDLYQFINDELPKKEWLVKLSATEKDCGITVNVFFEGQSSLFNCINDFDLSKAYSCMQYVEGYYLIRESVKRGIDSRQKKVEITFVLPNDESRYYLDLPKDLEQMLLLDFGKDLEDIEVNITFQFFKFDRGNLNPKPYIDRRPKAPIVKPSQIPSYFDYLLEASNRERR